MSRSQTRERNWSQNDEILVEAARNAGIDPRIMVKIAGFESNFSTTARPIATSRPHLNTVRQWDGTMAISSAYGLGQFLDETWHGMVRKYGERYGVENAGNFTRADANAPGIRDSPRLQAAMLAEFTRENIAAGARLGGPDPDANVYAMHNLGSGDARKFLVALRDNPTQRADQVLSARVISGNPSLYGDGSRTIARAYRAMGEHMDAYSPYADRIFSSPPRQPATPASRPDPTAVTASRPVQPVAPSGHQAIYTEAHLHFIANGNRFEYGRGDMTLTNREGNLRTDSSRTEQDIDRDGLKGVDCSSFVWRGLKNAGYEVPPAPFSTHALFNGTRVTAYAREHFDVIPAGEARRDRGHLQAGDIILFEDRDSAGQHVGIFKGYDGNGRIQFIGSQVSTGPAQAGAGQGSYWNGGEFEIVGALRAKPEFQVRPALHAGEAPSTERSPPAPRAGELPAARVSAEADGPIRIGGKGPAVALLQQRLFDLGYRGADGRPLGVDGDFGTNTRHAVSQFQREHGLQGVGVAGPRTAIALDRAERALMSHPSHPQHALYTQVLEKVHAEERTRGIASGHHSQRIAAALAVECLREGITRVDRVELNRDVTLVRGVQVSPLRDEPGLNRATDAISAPQASQQTLRESSEQMQQVAVNQQAQQRDLQQRERPAPALP